MDVKALKFLLDAVARSGTSELSLETPDYKVTIKRSSSGQVAQTVTVAPAITHQAPASALTPVVEQTPSHTASTVTAVKSNLIDITAPIVGTFYASPSPDAPAYTKVGDKIAPGRVLCIIEAMKLMNEIEAEVSGTIVEVLVKNEEPVEYGQVLFRVSLDK